MNTAEKLVKIAENEQIVAEKNAELEEALYSKSEGGKSWYDKYMEMIALHPEKTVSGSYISVDDVSELPHDVKCKVTGVDNPETVTVMRCGANLLPSYPQSGKANGATWTVNDDKSITINGTPTSNLALYFPRIKWRQKEDIQMSLSIRTVSYGGIQGCLIQYDKDGKMLTSVYVSTFYTVTILSDCAEILFILYATTGHTYVDAVVYPMLHIGSIGTPHEPYDAQILTPSEDGTVEGMTSTSHYMHIFTDDADAMLDVTYRISAGKQAEYDAFWDAYQENGSRTFYEHAFMHWKSGNYTPKYPIIATAGAYCFMDAQFESTKVEVDITHCTSTDYMFCMTQLEEITKLIVSEDVVFASTMFQWSGKIKNIVFEGVIGNSINFHSCPLTKASITNIVEHLSPTVTGQTITLNKAAKEAAFTADEWAELIADKTNWTFSLV